MSKRSSFQTAMKSLHKMLTFLALVAVCRSGVAAQDQSDVRTLAPSVPIERELAAGEAHSYLITLASGQYLRVSVAQKGINVIVKLSAPDNSQIAEVNNQNNVQLEEQVSLVTTTPGQYRFDVRPVEKSPLAGSYEIRVGEIRDATSQDNTRVAGERAYAQGELFRLHGAAESLHKAIAMYEEALPHWRSTGDRREEASTLHSIGLVYRLLGETQKALEYYNQALPLRREAGDVYGEAMTTHNIGAVYWNLGDNQKALEYYNRALPLRRAARDLWGESVTLSNIGTVYAVLGEYQVALDYWDQSLPLRRQARDRAGEGETLSNIGTLYTRTGDLQKALDYSNQSLKLRREVGDQRGEAASLVNIASVHLLSSDYQEALKHYNQALSLSRITGDRRFQATSLSNIGTIYIDLGEPQRALEHYSEALRLFHDIGDRANEAGVLARIAAVYKQTGEFQKALEHYDRSLLLSRSVGDRPQQATSLAGIGAVYAGMGDQQKALDYYNQALALHRQVGNRRGEAGTLNNIGLIHEHLGDEPKALEYFEQALLLERAVGERSGEATTLLSMARIERKLGKLNEARAHVDSALDIIESARTTIPGQDLRASYIASKQAGYRFYIDLLIQLDQSHPEEGHAATALLTSERARARSLMDTLVEARAGIRSGADSALLERERGLQQQINARAFLQSQLLNSKRAKQAEAIEKELNALLSEYQNVQAQIRSNSPSYAAITQPQPLTVSEIQQQVLDQDSLLLEYSLGKERSFLWAVTPNSITSHVLPKQEEIENAARRVYELTTARNRRPEGETPEQKAARVKEADAEYPKVASTLSQMLIGPVASQLGTKRLVIVSEGALHYVPFGALPTPKSLESGVTSLKSEKETNSRQRSQDSRRQTPDSRLPLIVEHEIVILPSASVLAVLRRELAGRASSPGAVAVLADPVFSRDDPRIGNDVAGSARDRISVSQKPASQDEVERSAKESGVMELRRLRFSRQEAEAITALAPKTKSLKAIDFAANRATATGPELSRYRVLHFATHGLLNSQHPELSGIVLSLVDERGHPQNGFLRLHEIYNLKLGADLVVLSACQTALGKEIKGEGLVGLTRGFMYAGAPRVVASLWNVDDRATAELMKRFYRAMFTQKMRPVAALKAAQTSLRREKGWAAPYYWAGFTLQGEWR